MHKAIEYSAVPKLKTRIRGEVISPGDEHYHEARRVWNGRIDKYPSMIVRCVDITDVLTTIEFARRWDIAVAVRSGGHSMVGYSVSDGGIVIDLSPMKGMWVDPVKGIAQVQAGLTLGEFVRQAQAFGLATTTGTVSGTGIGGLTLGGGIGWLMGKYGMTIDNLVSAEVITADGKKRRASENENADLFWAIRGGGGNFGVVTQFEFKLHPVGPEILAGLIVFPLDQAKQVLRKYREFVKSAPEELSVWVVLRQAPPLPFLPKEVHGKEVVVLAIFYTGDIAEGEKLIAVLRRFGDAHGEHIGALQYVQWQKAFDPLLAPGARNYWKSHNFTELGDEALDTMIEFAKKLPSPQCEILIGLIAGAANRVPADAMAYGHRDAKFVMNVHGRWDEAVHDKTCISWARAFFEASAPYASGGVYVNFMTEDERDTVATAYGANYARLQQIKKQFDPENIFHMNQNIKP